MESGQVVLGFGISVFPLFGFFFPIFSSNLSNIYTSDFKFAYISL